MFAHIGQFHFGQCRHRRRAALIPAPLDHARAITAVVEPVRHTRIGGGNHRAEFAVAVDMNLCRIQARLAIHEIHRGKLIVGDEKRPVKTLLGNIGFQNQCFIGSEIVNAFEIDLTREAADTTVIKHLQTIDDAFAAHVVHMPEPDHGRVLDPAGERGQAFVDFRSVESLWRYRGVEFVDSEARIHFVAPVIGGLADAEIIGVRMELPPVAGVAGRFLWAHQHFEIAVLIDLQRIDIKPAQRRPRRAGRRVEIAALADMDEQRCAAIATDFISAARTNRGVEIQKVRVRCGEVQHIVQRRRPVRVIRIGIHHVEIALRLRGHQCAIRFLPGLFPVAVPGQGDDAVANIFECIDQLIPGLWHGGFLPLQLNRRYRIVYLTATLPEPLNMPVTSPVRRQLRGRPVAQEQAQKQEYLLQVAREHFIERGFGECSIDGIAAASGVAKMTIYRWYGSKTGLFRAVMLHLAEETVEQLHDPLHDERPFEKVLQDLAWALYASQVKPSSAALTRLMIAEAPRFPKVVREIQTLVVRRSLMVVEKYFEELGRRKLLIVDDAFRMAHQFATLAVGSYRFLLIGADTDAEERARVSAGVALFLRGCAAAATNSTARSSTKTQSSRKKSAIVEKAVAKKTTAQKTAAKKAAAKKTAAKKSTPRKR
jgi:AcrR family transcriptional regulator